MRCEADAVPRARCARRSSVGRRRRRRARNLVAFSGGVDSTVLLAALARLSSARRCALRTSIMGCIPIQRAGARTARPSRPSSASTFARSASRSSARARSRSRGRRARGALCARSRTCCRRATCCSRRITATISSRRCCCGSCAARACAACAGSRDRAVRLGLARAAAARLHAGRDSRAGARLESALARGPGERDPRHDRNFLRADGRAALVERWPAAARSAQRLAEQMADAEGILDEVAVRDAARVATRAACRAPRSSRSSPHASATCCATCCARGGFEPPSAQKIEELRAALLGARHDAQPRIRWPGVEARVFREHLYLMGALPARVAARLRGAARQARPAGPAPRASSRSSGSTRARPARVLARRRAHAAFPRRRRRLPAARARAQPPAQALAPRGRDRPVDARAHSAPLPRRRPRRRR